MQTIAMGDVQTLARLRSSGTASRLGTRMRRFSAPALEYGRVVTGIDILIAWMPVLLMAGVALLALFR